MAKRKPLYLRVLARDLSARVALSDLLVALGGPPMGPLEGLDSLRARYRAALGSDAPACAAYVNDPDDGTGLCDTCGNERGKHAGAPPDAAAPAPRDWHAWGREIGEKIGRSLAKGILSAAPSLAEAVRDHYAKTFGKCRVCQAPLGGESPEKICEPCHAAEVLAQALRGAAGDPPPEA